MDLPNGKSFSQPNARARSRHIQPRIINPFSVHVTISYPFPIPRTYARRPHRVTIWWSRAHPYSPLLPTTGTPGIQAWWWPGGPRGRLRALCTLLRARPIFYAFLIQTAMFSILSFYELLLLYIHIHTLWSRLESEMRREGSLCTPRTPLPRVRHHAKSGTPPPAAAQQLHASVIGVGVCVIYQII